MATYGSYEAVRELYRGGFVTVSVARRIDGDAELKYVVKSFEPPPENLSPKARRQGVMCFLDAARAQQVVAESGAEHWAPIHEFKPIDGGAYYVTDLYPRSAQRLIFSEVKLDGHRLHTIITSVVNALIEMRGVCDRPHANLKVGNVLLVEPQPGVLTKVVLSDPLPETRIDAESVDYIDQKLVGELIHHLVLLKPVQVMGGWPVPDSPRWSFLGRKADAWRDLCNRLLDPDLAEQCPTLQQLAQEELPRLVAPPRRALPTAAVAAGVIIAAYGLGAIALPQGAAISRILYPWRSGVTDQGGEVLVF